MPIAINGSGTITGISVGGIPDGVVDTDVLAANAVTTPKLGTDEASGLCKAWVDFDGTGTVAIYESYNISSITDNGTGQYAANFTTAMVDADYATVLTPGTISRVCSCSKGLSTASSVDVRSVNLSGVYTDVSSIKVAVFR